MNEKQVAEALALVFDPELGIDVVALGLIYGIHIDDAAVEVEMTTTSPLCPMSASLLDAALKVLRARLPGGTIRIVSVSDPPWTPSMLNERARMKLGLPLRG